MYPHREPPSQGGFWNGQVLSHLLKGDALPVQREPFPLAQSAERGSEILSTIQTPPENSKRKAGALCPIGQRLRDVATSQQPIPGCVTHLVSLRDPSTVTGLIVAIIVAAINRMVHRR